MLDSQKPAELRSSLGMNNGHDLKYLQDRVGQGCGGDSRGCQQSLGWLRSLLANARLHQILASVLWSSSCFPADVERKRAREEGARLGF